MNVHKRHLSRACLFEFLKIEYLATLSLLPHRKIVVTNSFCAQSRERRPAANATDGRGRHALHAHAQYNTPRGVWKEFEIFSPLQPADIGWLTGNGKKLSFSQACCLGQLCLAAT